MTWSSPMFAKLYSNDSDINPLLFPITKEQDALIASLINVGAIFGGIPFGYAAECFGRKVSLLVIGVFHIVAYLTMAFATNVELFYFGRVLGGFAVGGGYTLLPIYIAEVVEESKRGAYSVTLAIFWGFGNFLPYLIGPFISVRTFNLINFAFPCAFFILFSFFGTESPFYLVGANQLDQAEKVLMVLRSKDNKGVQDELNHIKDTLDEENNSVSFTTILKNPGIRKAFIISISLISLQQLTGWSPLTFYLQPIFEASGAQLPSEISSIIIGGAMFIFTLPTPYFTSKFGRKTLLIFSSVVTSLCLLLLSGFFFVQTRTDMNTSFISWVPLTSLLILTFAFELGLACLPWTISSEIFPKNVKGISSSVTSATCWTVSFLMTQFFNDMTDALGTDGTFLIFAGFSIICAIFTLLYVPETRGKTFKEIQRILQK